MNESNMVDLRSEEEKEREHAELLKISEELDLEWEREMAEYEELLRKDGVIDKPESEEELLKKEEKRQKLERKRIADDIEYMRKARKLGRYDPLPPPRNTRRCGGCVAYPITDATRPRLTELTNLALEKYNHVYNKKRGPPFHLDELVKASQTFCNGRRYCITFKAKRSSDTSSTIFQAVVYRNFDWSYKEVMSCHKGTPWTKLN